MQAMLTVQLERPIRSAALISALKPKAVVESPSSAMQAELTAQIQRYQELCRTLEAASTRLNDFYTELFSAHSESIAKLSTEIARKILMRNVSEGDYAIETIVAEALKNAPDADDIVIRLNPQDLEHYRQLQLDGNVRLAGAELLADPEIGRGECVLESAKGVVRSLIDEHLERIGRALEKTDSAG